MDVQQWAICLGWSLIKMSFTQIVHKIERVLLTTVLKVFESAWLSETEDQNGKQTHHSWSENQSLIRSCFLTAIKWCLPGSFPSSQQSLSLCPVESLMISAMFPMMLHLSVLLWQRAGLLSFPLDSSITHLWLQLSLHQNNAVPEWISMSFTLGGNCHYFTQTQEKKMWFRACYKKSEAGMFSRAAELQMCLIWRKKQKNQNQKHYWVIS